MPIVHGMGECPNGHEVPDGQQFCGQCGSAVLVPVDVEPTIAPNQQRPDISPARRVNGKQLVAIGVVALALLVVAAVLLGGGADKRTIKGRFSLIDSDVTGSADSCEGTGGYSDVESGMPVTVRNEKGEIVGGASTTHASLDELVERLVDEGKNGGGEFTTEAKARDFLESRFVCVLIFDVDVKDAAFYEVEVGRRGKISYSKAELDRRDWNVAMGLS